MGIFSGFAERKVISETQKVLELQKDNYRRFARCKDKQDWFGAATDARMMLEAAAWIEHKMTLHVQNHPSADDYNTKFSQYSLAVFQFTQGMAGELGTVISQQPEFQKVFVKQMASEKSQWKQRMIWVLTRENQELDHLEAQIMSAT